MMSKKNPNEKKKIFDFYYTELPAIAEYLEKQESEGYKLKEIDRNTMIFEKCEPRRIRYTAEIFKGSTPDDFIDSCAIEGWELTGQYNNELYIFRTQKSDAVDIMTDEKEKLKICARRILRQPGTLTGFVLVLLYILRFILDLNTSISITLFETDAMNFFALMFIGLVIFINLITIFDYFVWRFIIFRRGAASQFFSLKNTVRKRRMYAVFACLYLVAAYFITIWLDPEFLVSISDIAIALILLCIIYSGLTLSKLSFNKKEKTKKALLTLIVITVIVGGLSVMSKYNEKRSVEISKTMLSLEEIPISLTDLGIKTKSCENEGYVDGTRFGRMYRFTSDAELYEFDEYTSSYLSYNILISDYPNIRQKYIDKILDKYSDYDLELVKVVPPETEWDYYYKLKFKDENEYDGFAVKDNVVVYLSWSVLCKKDFFEIAYEKLFTE